MTHSNFSKTGRAVVLYTKNGATGKSFYDAFESLDRRHAGFVSNTGDGAVYKLPLVWLGSDDNQAAGNPMLSDGKPIWRIDHLYPVEPLKPENYHPMAWSRDRWKAPDHNHGGHPSAKVNDGNVSLGIMGPWSGDLNFRKVGVLAFIAPEAGQYKVTGRARSKNWDGNRPTQIERLHKLIDTDDEAKARADEVRRAAKPLREIEPTPLAVIHYEGLVNTDPRRIATVKKLRQISDVALLVRHWQATGDAKAAATLKPLILAWAAAYQPTGNDINENKLYPLLIAYEALRDDFSERDRDVVDIWVRRFGELHEAAVKKSNHFTNRYSKHLRLLALAGMILDKPE